MISNLRKWIEDAIRFYGEPLESVVVGKSGGAPWNAAPNPDENVVLLPEVALAKIDEDFDSGYGSACCYPIFAWTASRVFFISEYDGATSLAWVPRHPAAAEVQFSGVDVGLDEILRKQSEKAAA